MSGLRVLTPGPLSLLQDGGRHGWQHFGVSPAGALDLHAAAWANRLLDNPWGTPLLEIALGYLELQSELDTWLALTGAQVTATVDGAPLPPWSRFPLRAGQRLKLGYARSGQRAYLAVAGGFRAAPQLGSVSTQQREGVGGLQGTGEPLCAGDLLPCLAADLPRALSVPWPYQPDYRAPVCLRVIGSGDTAGLASDQLQAFFARSWQLSAQSDRMGARLLGEPLIAPTQQWSQGVGRGAIQLPPDGQPIILQADHQTMGGYPILGWLHPLDQARLAQCPAHHELRFSPVGIDQAQAELRAFYRFFGR